MFVSICLGVCVKMYVNGKQLIRVKSDEEDDWDPGRRNSGFMEAMMAWEEGERDVKGVGVWVET